AIMTFLEEKLERLKAYRKDRLELAYYIINNPDEFENRLNFANKTDNDISYKAAWIIAMLCIVNLCISYPHLDLLHSISSKVYKKQAVRPLSKVCELITENYYSKNSQRIQNIVT